MRYNIKNWSYRNRVGSCGLDSSGLGWVLVTGSCEHSNEYSGSVKCWYIYMYWRSQVQFLMSSFDFFNWPNPSSHTMALESTQRLTEMSTRNLPGGKVRPASKADNLITICGLIAQKMWEPRRLTTLWASMACYRDSFTFLYIYMDSSLHMWYVCIYCT
jgi:hypothetical protein